ncbi:50S ribosomal protein L7/L12 [Striga asiatica]|uniref:50S ribosomal protein L7/L12 n=1 Tax=Striga asiatica TaxID=4170 RepID=A0A5A7R1N0_STRAF|nr:50S ribosomal protein L7/L12 [Striga asiatica]
MPRSRIMRRSSRRSRGLIKHKDIWYIRRKDFIILNNSHNATVAMSLVDQVALTAKGEEKLFFASSARTLPRDSFTALSISLEMRLLTARSTTPFIIAEKKAVKESLGKDLAEEAKNSLKESVKENLKEAMKENVTEVKERVWGFATRFAENMISASVFTGVHYVCVLEKKEKAQVYNSHQKGRQLGQLVVAKDKGLKLQQEGDRKLGEILSELKGLKGLLVGGKGDGSGEWNGKGFGDGNGSGEGNGPAWISILYLLLLSLSRQCHLINQGHRNGRIVAVVQDNEVLSSYVPAIWKANEPM